MRSRKTTVVTLILAVVLMLVATQCGGQSGGTAGAPAGQPAAQQAPAPGGQPAAKGAAQQPVELRLAWWGSQDRHDRTIKVIELFQKKYPHIKITYEFAAFNDYWTKMTTQAAGGGLPDVMQQDYAYISEWNSRGLLKPLDDYVKDGTLNFGDVSEDFLKGGRINDKLIAVNLGSNSQNWVLDVDAFKKAGVELPADNWTWADFEKTTLALHQKLGIWGHGAALTDNQLWKSLYLSLGEWSYSADGTTVGYKDDKPLVDHLNMTLRLQKAGAIPTRAEEIANYEGKSVEQLPMVTSKAAMEYFWSNQITAVWKAAGDNRTFKLVPLPRPAGGKSANYIKPSQFFSVTSQAKHPKEAAMFIDFFTNDLEANDILAAERGVPISSKVRDHLKPKLGKAQQEMFDYVARVSKDAQPIPPADPPGHTDIVSNIYTPQVVDQVRYERMAPDKAAAVLRQEATTILAKNKK
jgi:multiple sugar transport system substrate-binding protein